MSFLNPLFLVALITVGVPLLIYLLNLRKPRKVRFSTLAFFDSLKTTALKRIRIKRWLLLAVRMLAVAALVVAASRPFLPSGLGVGNENEPRVAGVLIDNSPAMVQVDRNGPFFEQALSIVQDIANSADSEDRFLIDVTHGESLNTPFLSPQGLAARTGGLEPVNKGNYFGERMMRLRDRLAEAREPNKIIYLVTDGRTSRLEEFAERFSAEETDVALHVLRVGDSRTSNTGFGEVRLVNSAPEDGNITIEAELVNYGAGRTSNQFLSLFAGGELISQQPFELGEGASQTFRFDLPAGNSSERYIEAELLIEGDELTFDNRHYVAIEMPEVRRVLVVEETISGRIFNSYLRPVLEIASAESNRFSFTFENLGDLQPGDVFEYDAVILDGIRNIPDYLIQALTDHVQTGAGLLFLPAAEGNMSSYNRLLGLSEAGRYANVNGSYGSFRTIDRMAPPEDGHPVLDNIFEKDDDEEIRVNAPELFYYYQIEAGPGSFSFPVLSTSSGRPLLQEVRAGNGRLIYSAIGSDPGWSNFPIKPFFAPLFFRTIEYLARGSGAAINNHELGTPFRTVLARQADQAEIIRDNEIIVPDLRQTFRGTEITYAGSEWSPGLLRLQAADDVRLFSVNQNAMESRLHTLGVREIEALFDNYFISVTVTESGTDREAMLAGLQSGSFGREIWFWFIIAAIILLIAESLISRFFKAETIS
jgi:hypothetical protein